MIIINKSITNGLHKFSVKLNIISKMTQVIQSHCSALCYFGLTNRSHYTQVQLNRWVALAVTLGIVWSWTTAVEFLVSSHLWTKWMDRIEAAGAPASRPHSRCWCWCAVFLQVKGQRSFLPGDLHSISCFLLLTSVMEMLISFGTCPHCQKHR